MEKDLTNFYLLLEKDAEEYAQSATAAMVGDSCTFDKQKLHDFVKAIYKQAAEYSKKNY